MTDWGSVYHAYDGEATYNIIVKERALEKRPHFQCQRSPKELQGHTGHNSHTFSHTPNPEGKSS
jgi:hypothetical protein